MSHAHSQRLARLAVGTFMGAALASLSAAQGYKFTIIDSSNATNLGNIVYGKPVINDAGEVAFSKYDVTSASNDTLYKSSGGALTTMANTTGPIRAFLDDYVRINNLGHVIVTGTDTFPWPNGSQLIVLATGTSNTVIASGALLGLPNGTYGTYRGWSLDDSDVAIVDVGGAAPHGIYRASAAGMTQAWSNTNCPPGGATMRGAWSNNLGQFASVAIYCSGPYWSGGCGLNGINSPYAAVLVAGATPTVLAPDDDPRWSAANSVSLQLNDLGQVAYRGGGCNSLTVIRADVSGPTVIDDNQSFNDAVAINDHGQVAYSTSTSLTGDQVWVGDGVAKHRVVGSGDHLAGSSVHFATIGYQSINDSGQIAAIIDLVDNRRMIVRFDPVPAPSTYCTSGTSFDGCTPTIASSGIPSATNYQSFTLSCSGLPAQKNGFFFYGVSGRSSAPWGNSTSVLCVNSPTQRMLPVLTANGTSAPACDGVISTNWNAWIAANPSAFGAPFAPGAVVDAQLWYRDSQSGTGPVGGKGTALSNALEFTVGL